MTDTQDQELSDPGKDGHHGCHGNEEAAGTSVVHAGARGRDRGLCRQGERTVGQVAKDFDLTETATRLWLKQAETDAGERSDVLTSDEKAEVAALRRENQRLQEDVEILKRATALFAKETR